MSDQQVNPTIPISIGALLAEEVTIDPFSTLPSFLEMMMIEETTTSTERSLSLAISALVEKAKRLREGGKFVFMARIVETFGQAYRLELRCVMKYIVQRRCLQRVHATVAEAIYGGRRARIGKEGKLSDMNDRDRTRLALVLALSTYIKERLDLLFEQSRQNNRVDNTTTTRLVSLFVKLYPFLHMTHEGSIFSYHFFYLLNHSIYFDPLSHMLGLVVRRITSFDVKQTSVPPSPPLKSSTENSHFVNMARAIAFYGLSSTLLLGWISRIQQAIRTQPTRYCNSLIPPAPDPPKYRLDPNQRLRIPTDSQTCALCQQPRRNPTASTSGHVFCHRCLLLHVREHGKCPLTGRDCREQDIVRIFEPGDVPPTSAAA